MGLTPDWADNLANILTAASGAPSWPSIHLQVYTTLPTASGGYTDGVTPLTGDGYPGPVDIHGSPYFTGISDGSGTPSNEADISFGTPTGDGLPVVGAAITKSDGTVITKPEEFGAPMDWTSGVEFIVPTGTVSLPVGQ